jgi:hypothetical protein
MMSAAVLKEQTDRVRDASEIVEVVGDYVHLRKVGNSGRYTGLCPFHKEKTASFHVNQTRQFYKCFGCGAGGDVFKFVMEIEGVSFVSAKDQLAVRAGVHLDRREMTPAERHHYARAAAGADTLAVRLADFANGLLLATERKLLEQSPALLDVELDPSETLADLHRQVHDLRRTTAVDITRVWRAMRSKNPATVATMERIGREDREHAEAITKLIVTMLAASADRELGSPELSHRDGDHQIEKTVGRFVGMVLLLYSSGLDGEIVVYNLLCFGNFVCVSHDERASKKVL